MESNSHDLHYAQKNNLYLQEVTGEISTRRKNKTKKTKAKTKLSERKKKGKKHKTNRTKQKTARFVFEAGITLNVWASWLETLIMPRFYHGDQK